MKYHIKCFLVVTLISIILFQVSIADTQESEEAINRGNNNVIKVSEIIISEDKTVEEDYVVYKFKTEEKKDSGKLIIEYLVTYKDYRGNGWGNKDILTCIVTSDGKELFVLNESCTRDRKIVPLMGLSSHSLKTLTAESDISSLAVRDLLWQKIINFF